MCNSRLVEYLFQKNSLSVVCIFQRDQSTTSRMKDIHQSMQNLTLWVGLIDWKVQQARSITGIII